MLPMAIYIGFKSEKILSPQKRCGEKKRELL